MYIDGINCNLCMSVHDSMSGTSLDEEVYRIGQYCMEDQTAIKVGLVGQVLLLFNLLTFRYYYFS